MAGAIEGTPTHILNAANYTAETTGSDRVVVFVIHHGNTQNQQIATVTMGAQSATIFTQTAADSHGACIAYILDADIPTGAQAVTFTATGGTIDASGITCYTLSGIDQTSPEDGSDAVTNSGASDTISFTGVTTTNEGIVIGGAAFDNFTNRTWTPPTGWTEDTDVGSDGMSKCSAHLAADGSTESGSFVMDTSRNGDRSLAVAAFAPSAGSQSPVPIIMQYHNH